MGDIEAFVLAIVAMLISVGLLLGWINYKIDKLKKDNKLSIETIGSIITLEKAMKKLNEALKIHEHRLDHERDDIYGIQRRLDILEANHPDDEINYGTVDDDGNITEVWFEGKRYVPEDKRDEDTVAFYADGRVVAKTTRPEEKRCCATCQHYRPGSGYSTCDLRTWLYMTKKYATMSDSACNNYKKISGNGKVETAIKKIDELQIKIDYITLCQEQDKLRNKEIGFNKLLSSAMQSGIMSAREWREFMEDLNNDS